MGVRAGPLSVTLYDEPNSSRTRGAFFPQNADESSWREETEHPARFWKSLEQSIFSISLFIAVNLDELGTGPGPDAAGWVPRGLGARTPVLTLAPCEASTSLRGAKDSVSVSLDSQQTQLPP